tara:strand:+ start:1580 stop:2152 length:573 start_codon:yes stop_codon:yes gene_type:complete
MIYTTTPNKDVSLPYLKSNRVISKDNLSFTIIFTAYVEAMFDDLEKLLDSKVDQSVKKKLRLLISRFDHSNQNWLSSDSTAQLHFNLCSQIENHRNKAKKKILSKRESLNDFMMFLSYEIYILSDRIKQLDTSSISPYKNTLTGLLNSFNNYLNKNNYQDKLDIHKKRNDIQRIFLGCEEDFAKEYKKVK